MSVLKSLPRSTKGLGVGVEGGGGQLNNPVANVLGKTDPGLDPDALEGEMANHSSILAWRILWTGEP